MTVQSGFDRTAETPIQRFDRAVSLYLENHRYCGSSEQTIKNYAGRLAIFRRFWLEKCEQQPLHDPDSTIIREWRNSLVDEGKSARTVAQYLSELRYFFIFASDDELEEDKIYDRNPVSKRIIPKPEQRPYDEILSNDLVMKLWKNEAPIPQLKPNWARNYAIVVLLLTSEIRNKELLDLRLYDVNFPDGYITIESGKGGKFRVVDIPEIAVIALKIYLQSGIRPSCALETDPLFGTSAGPDGHDSGGWHRGTAQWLSSVVERHVAAVTGVSGVRSHALRHIGARLDLTSCVMGMEMLQGKLGHASPSTTQIYCGRLTSRRQTISAKEVMAAQQEAAEQNRKKVRLEIA